jgi:hypothetical protein
MVCLFLGHCCVGRSCEQETSIQLVKRTREPDPYQLNRLDLLSFFHQILSPHMFVMIQSLQLQKLNCHFRKIHYVSSSLVVAKVVSV